jgi:L-iditol 2-dehydrogenase
LQLAKIAGADVIIFDIVDSSLNLAKELGADMVVNTKKEDGYKKLMTLPLAISFTRIGGKAVIVGGFSEGKTTTELEWQHMQMAEIQLIMSASYSLWGIYPEMKICLDLLAKGKLNAKKMITHSFPLQEINKAFETARDKEHTDALFVALTID